MSKTLSVILPKCFPNENLPFLNIEYYSDSEESKAFFQNLLKISNYRCMYCGKTLSGGSTNGIYGTFEREHTIEKRHNKITSEYLKHCKFNFGVSCGACNNHKRKKILKLEESILNKIDYKKCLTKKCKQPCKEYLELYDLYTKENMFIYKPIGANLSGKELGISFNILSGIYEVPNDYEYDLEEISIINNTINKLELNDLDLEYLDALKDLFAEKYFKDEIGYIEKYSISNRGNHKNKYPNVIDDLIIDLINSLDEKQKKIVIKMIIQLEI